ncbi:MAG: hypothetical protein ACRC7S_19610 [Cetobacterium sp.]
MPTQNYIYQDLRTNAPNCELPDSILQGTTKRTFAFTLFDRDKQSLLEQNAEITAVVIYDPKYVNGQLVYKGSFVLDKNNANYNITTVKESIGGNDFTVVLVPFHEEFTTFAGNCEFILKIVESGIVSYSYQMQFTVDRNDGYFPQSIPNNLPSFQSLLQEITDLKSNKADKTLKNVSDQDFINKAQGAGIGNAETGKQIKQLLEAENPGLSYNSLSDKPTIPPEGANKTLSNVNDSDFEKKGKASNFAQNDLEDVDIQKLNEKGKVAGLLETVKVGETHGNYNEGDVKEIQFHNELDVTIDTQNKVATISVAPSVAKNDMKGILPETLSEKIKLTNAYQDLINKNLHPAITGITIDDVKKLFEANFFEETTSVDLTQTPFTSLTLYMQYQFNSSNSMITQKLPPVAQNKIIMVSKVNATGITNTTLTLNPNDGETINGASAALSFGADKDGYLGYFLPLINQNGYEFIPHEVAHDFSIAVSDDKNNVIIGRNSIKFKKATVSNVGDIVEVTPDPNSGGGGITGINVIDSAGATTTDVTIVEFANGNVAGDGRGKATVTIPTTSQGSMTFKTSGGAEFTSDKMFSIDKSIEFVERQENGKNVAGVLINPALIPSQHNEGIHAVLGNTQLLNSEYPKAKMFFSDIRCKGGKFVYPDMNTKSFVIQDTDPQDDPNVSGGTTFIVAMYFDPSIENASITQDGDIEIQLVDDNDVVLKNTDGLPVTALIKYKNGDIPRPELYIGEIKASAFTRVHMKIKLNFPTEEIIYVGPNTQLCLQSINQYESSGIALLSFMLFTGYRFGFETKYYGYNSINLARFLLFDRPQADVPAGSTVDFGENLYVNFKTRGKAEITGNKLILQDNGVDLPVFSISRMYTKLDCAYLGDKNMKITVKITNKEGAFIVGMLEYVGSDEKPPIPFVTGYNNSNPVFTNGWVKRDELFIVEDPTKDEHTEIKEFQLPKDAQGIAFVLYPMDTVVPCKLTLGDFEGDITPWFTKTIISSNSHIKEMQIYNKDLYRFATYTPSGYNAYRMTANKADTKLGIGKNFSAGDILSSKAWDVIEGIDPDKVQADLIANKDGKGFMQYSVRAFNDTATDNDLIVYLGKKNPDNTYTEVYQSRLATTIGHNTSVPEILYSTEFALDFKAGDIFRLFMKSNVDDGFYLQSNTDGVPLSSVKISVDDMSAVEAKLVELDLRTNEVRFVEDGVEVFNKILQYDIKTAKMTVVDK